MPVRWVLIRMLPVLRMLPGLRMLLIWMLLLAWMLLLLALLRMALRRMAILLLPTHHLLLLHLLP